MCILSGLFYYAKTALKPPPSSVPLPTWLWRKKTIQSKFCLFLVSPEENLSFFVNLNSYKFLVGGRVLKEKFVLCMFQGYGGIYEIIY